MTDALARLRADVTHGDVLRAIQEYDRLGPDRFFSEHGFGPSRSYELVWDQRRYPHKAILGTAYELATGQRLGSGDFEGGKSGAVAILTKLDSPSRTNNDHRHLLPCSARAPAKVRGIWCRSGEHPPADAQLQA